ncbi:MAG: polyprenyl synthetase family protein [Cellvibrionales bacterium]|nr:polyprenyl synthetase family protein [Cellvibrionales bacterium]
MTTESLADFFIHSQCLLENAFNEILIPLKGEADSAVNPPLVDAMQYCLTNGGKRLRAILVFAAFDAVADRERPASLVEVAAAVECLHAYSLVHDDLPSMDNDDLRRGKPTCHIAYDEATAILVGDALQTLAFDLLANSTDFSASQRLSMVQVLASASGASGMVLGQAMDLQAENKTLTLAQLENVHSLKTGALIRAAVALGAIAGGASQQQRDALDDYAKYLGLAFQIQDDILDVESDTETLGKSQGADIALNKSTYPKLLGMDNAKQKAAESILNAKAALSLVKSDQALYAIADFVTDRRY